MSLEIELKERSGLKCELCASKTDLKVYNVPPKSTEIADDCIFICNTCLEQIEDPKKIDPNHWRCLNDSMWSSVPAVQVMAWRMLNQLRSEGWPVELLDMLYLDDETLAWAKESVEETISENSLNHIDSNGTLLEAGDSVVLIKDLNVKGANFTAKRGTSVRNISLVWDNPEQIEGKVNGQEIVILTKFVKKSS